ncbi:NAD-dependent epimerase/dehydratase family protein [Streptomyces sulphureus]|uniref:NAD-dependent epimerase/dehydratase family protein n=1 Tax=Streptomyces sulphureus TaxID=47758 RepID=UPI00037F803F|nr:SDR family oxidoreductase [Streptomyces sulphureus]
MRVVLLGGAGYIGSVISAELLANGDEVTVVDDLIYATKERRDKPPFGTNFVRGDFRDENLLRDVVKGADAVVALGGLVGEPACDLDQDLTVELNYASAALAGEIAGECGVQHFVFLSTCSVYGRQDGLGTEETPANPLSSYARTKLLAEEHLAKVCQGNLSLTVLRLATVFGLSPRMRLDSVVNSMASRAARTGEIPLRGGAQWRPLLHVRDIAEVARRALHEKRATHPEPYVLNVGSDEMNYTIEHIAETVAGRIEGARVVRTPQPEDQRDYRISFARIREVFPGSCARGLGEGVDEIAAAVASGEFADLDQVGYDNLRGLRLAIDENRAKVLRTPAMRRLADEYEGRWTQA